MTTSFLKETKVLLVIITIFLWFNTNAQAVRVIDNKGTVETIRNNQVTFDNVAPPNPLEGDVWYDTTTTPITVNIWDEPSGTWLPVPNQFWSLTGNIATNPTTNFVGTIDAQDLVLKSGDIEKIRLFGTKGQVLINQAPTFNDHPLVVRANGVDVLAFQDNTGVPRWHWNLLANGLNFVESNVLDFRLFLENGGNIGINTNDPTERLDINGRLRIRDIETVSTDLDILIATPDGVVQKKPLLAAEADNQLTLGTNGGVYLPTATSNGPLNVQTQTIGYVFAAGLTQGNNGNNLFNINSSVTNTANGQYTVTFNTAHPNGANYSIVLGVEEDDTNRDARIIQVIDGSQTANGFSVMILTGDNGGTADPLVEENWSFQVAAEITVVTNVTQGTTPPVASTTPVGTEDTTGASLRLFNFADRSNRFQISLGNTTGNPVNYEILLSNVPYNSIPNLSTGNYTVSAPSSNPDGTFNFLFTSTAPLAAFQNLIITGDFVTPNGNTFGGQPTLPTTIRLFTR